ncbi:DUF3307 domain-containing protein [Streptomyces sp. NPDC059708]|uniref:DUF3307 domain-containing protein n=1 Tax=Streptomyces sp. NPDC059708 TaxID=3346916 RepID=UPI0036BF7DB0
MFAQIAFLLYVAHMLADYPLQTDHQAAHKADKGGEGWRANLAHAATHVVSCGVALAVGAWLLPDVRLSAGPAALALLWIGASHGFIDRRWPVAAWMKIARQTKWAQHGGAAHVDQTAHILALAVAALAFSV